MTFAKNSDAISESAALPESEDIIIPPCDLWSDEPPLESDLHRDQIELLLACLKWWWRERTDFYATGNLTIYFSEEHITTRDFRGPDFFVVLGVENRPRRSWMLWAEQGKYPNVIIELLSNSTAKVDKGFKKTLYQDTFRTPEYFWFHPETLEFQGFRLMGGQYQPLEPNAQGWLWSQQLELFLGVHESHLRFFTPENQLVPTPEERAEVAQQQAEVAQQQAEAERKQRELAQQRVEELLARLKELGVDPDVPEQ
jgi:Uma2 family endonuclease